MLQRQFIQKVCENERYDWGNHISVTAIASSAMRSADRSSSALRMFVQSFEESVCRNH